MHQRVVAISWRLIYLGCTLSHKEEGRQQLPGSTSASRRPSQPRPPLPTTLPSLDTKVCAGGRPEYHPATLPRNKHREPGSARATTAPPTSSIVAPYPTLPWATPPPPSPPPPAPPPGGTKPGTSGRGGLAATGLAGWVGVESAPVAVADGGGRTPPTPTAAAAIRTADADMQSSLPAPSAGEVGGRREPSRVGSDRPWLRL